MSNMVDDAVIGQNSARLRGAMSQKALAERMKDRGWKWVQSTVASVEKGERPLRLREAADLASILGCSIEDLMNPPAAVADLQAIRDSDQEVSAAFFDAGRVMVAYLEAYSALDSAVRDSPLTDASTVIEAAQSTLGYCTPYNVISNAVQNVVAMGPAQWSPDEWISRFGGIDSITAQMTGIKEIENWREMPRPVYGDTAGSETNAPAEFYLQMTEDGKLLSVQEIKPGQQQHQDVK